MFCPKCGKEIPNQAAFCPKCGAALAGRPSGSAPKPSGSAPEKNATTAGLASALKEKIARAAAARPKKERKDRAGSGGKRVGKRKMLLIAAVAFIVLLILISKLPSSTDTDQNDPIVVGQGTLGASDEGTEGAVAVGQGELGGTPGESTESSDDIVKLGKDGKRSLKGESKEYKENYNYVFDHQSEIVAAYYQASQQERAEIANSFKGSLNALRDVVAAVDPKIFDMIALDAAADNADSFLGMHLIYSGVNAYFSDSELGRGLRDISENLILSAAMNSYETEEDAIRKDELVLCSSSTDYALMQTRGTLDEILRQMDVDSGYNTAVAALTWYDGELSDLLGQNIEEDLDIMWNGNGDQEAVQVKWDAIRGRMAAVQDCKQGWTDSRNEWINKLLHDVGLDKDLSTFTIADASKRIYALFDRDGKQHGVFTALDLTNLTILDDGSIVYREGPDDNANLIKRDFEGNVLVNYSNVGINGYNTISSSSNDLINSYFLMAACGNVLRRRTVSDFERGEYQVLELVRPDESAEEILEARRIENALPYYLPGIDHYGPGKPNNGWTDGARATSDAFSIGYYALDGGNRNLLIDMKTGKALDESDYISQFGNTGDYAAYLNDRYFIRDQSFTSFKLPDPNSVYDKADQSTPVVDLSEGGGVQRMFYSEESDQYWVISKTGYYYALDNHFQRTAEPVKLPGTLWDFCPFGLVIYQDDKTFGLYDGRLKLLRTFPAIAVTGFMSGNVNILTGEQMQLELTA